MFLIQNLDDFRYSLELFVIIVQGPYSQEIINLNLNFVLTKFKQYT